MSKNFFPSKNLVSLGSKRNLGENDYFQPLSLLIESLKKEADLSLFGSLSVAYLLNNQLRTRSKIFNYIKNTEVSEPSQPIFIMGLPRSGTTFLFHLLGLDKDHRSPYFWEILHTFPLTSSNSQKEKRRIKRTNFELSLLNNLIPEMKIIHPIHSNFPEECTLLTAFSMRSYSYIYIANVPSYENFLKKENFSPGFLWHSRFLQVLETKRKPLRWLLKDPNHVEHLPEIINQYPKARFIHIHRDPSESIASICSVTSKVRAGFSKKQNNFQIGSNTLDFWQNALEKYLDHKTIIPSDQIFDIQFQDLIKDPLKSIESIYSYFGFDLKENFIEGIIKFLKEPTKLKEGKHKYDLKDFGLNEILVRERMNKYIKEKVKL